MPIRPPAEILGPLLMERDRMIYSITQTINLTFSAAEVGCAGQAGEVDRLVYFFLEGLPALENQFRHIFRPHRIRPTISGIFCHQTPRVEPQPSAKLAQQSCELGDLLFLITYGRRLYNNYLGNAFLVQAKQDARSVRGTLQECLYETADSFLYRSPGGLAGQYRNLTDCPYALWYWEFTDRVWWSELPYRWSTGGLCARRHIYPQAEWPFSLVLADLICGVVGRRVRASHGTNQQDWSRIVDDMIRHTAKSTFRRQNAYISRNREPLRGEDAIRAVGATGAADVPFLIRSSFGHIFKIFDPELHEIGMKLEYLSEHFDEEKFKKEQHERFRAADEGSISEPPRLGNERPDIPEGGDGGCSFVIMDFSLG
jgi:hypothetical protein